MIISLYEKTRHKKRELTRRRIKLKSHKKQDEREKNLTLSKNTSKDLVRISPNSVQAEKRYSLNNPTIIGWAVPDLISLLLVAKLRRQWYKSVTCDLKNHLENNR